MIKVNEIRIGNYIIEEDGCLAKVIGFKPYDHSVRCDEEEGCELLVDVFTADGRLLSGRLSESQKSNPIPLTPEWLGKAGASNEDGGCIISNNYMFRKNFYRDSTGNYKGFLVSFKSTDGEKYFGRAIEYLHQLQNLYFALTWVELEIKMESV